MGLSQTGMSFCSLSLRRIFPDLHLRKLATGRPARNGCKGLKSRNRLLSGLRGLYGGFTYGIFGSK